MWTEFAVRSLVTTERMTPLEYEAILLSLITRGYEFTPLYPTVLLTAASRAGWQSDDDAFMKTSQWLRSALSQV